MKHELIGLLLLEVRQWDAPSEVYLLPITCVRAELDEGAIAVVRDERGITTTMRDATPLPELWLRLLAMIHSRHRPDGQAGHAAPWQAAAFRDLFASIAKSPPMVHLHAGEQSNASATISAQFHAKLYRKLAPGENPELEIGRYLTETARFPYVPAMVGAIDYDQDHGDRFTLAILHEARANEGNAWTWTVEMLRCFLLHIPPYLPAPSSADEVTPLAARELIRDYLTLIERLGKRTAELHLALAAGKDSSFAPEPFDVPFQRALQGSMCDHARFTMALLRRQRSALSAPIQGQADQLLDLPDFPDRLFHALVDQTISAQRIRCHGDYHLGQVLFTGTDFVIIDFEGEPDRPFEERRSKSSPLRDVAGMIRSLHYASRVALADFQREPRTECDGQFVHAAWLDAWCHWSGTSYLRAYLNEAARGTFLPQDPDVTHTLLQAYMLDKAFYELRYELNHRPAWVGIPLDALRRMVT